ncbi:phenylalanyl-tRNA synthetase alpha chain [Alicyclobacillus tengchongensis]|uniref:Phenylalanine--tRNA ligase alpha subunit n=2 Tax=Alicyclobacillus tolerans TaxID=90970 RepID=A0ABT9LSL4_9BACL|nr:phenylalanyl-tRNA synthetase alpha chain [Alicyclobacillus tengchongensis]
MDMDKLQRDIPDLRSKALAELSSLEDRRTLDAWRVEYLGKKSEIAQWMKMLGNLSPDDRRMAGQQIHALRQTLESAFTERMREMDELEIERKLREETLDITLPGTPQAIGHLHPITRILMEIEDIFVKMGFAVVEGPEVETDAYNFEMLNVPKDHPARDMQDTFYLSEELLLRTHTSPMQVRVMEQMRPNIPVKVIVPGRVYRRDEDDATHSHAFHQVEGLVVDKNIRMSDLKGTLEEFAKALFGPEQAVRLRPSFFPFTEPSAEVDVRCIHCKGQGCRVCKQTGWIEILGAGMVHPNVLAAAGYSPDAYSGFAFGMGPERIAMLKYGISDIRLLYQNDLRFLRQFSQLR